MSKKVMLSSAFPIEVSACAKRGSAAFEGYSLFPASKATKKELFPVIDRDGIAKPAILLIVEEALDAGVEGQPSATVEMEAA